MRTLAVLIVMLALCTARAGVAQPFQNADALLDAIETADASIDRLSADIYYQRIFALAGDEQHRLGGLAFVREPDDDGSPTRRFAVRFDTLIVGERREDDGRMFVFDGEWLTERIPEDRLMIRRQVAPPGSGFDPLRVGEGPLPLPLGQRKDDILSSYEVSMPEPNDGTAERADAEQLAAFITGQSAQQLRLVPRDPEDDFTEIRLWYARSGPGVLPCMSMTTNRTGDVVVVQLINVRLNADAEIDDRDFDTAAPEGWDEDVAPYRGAAAPEGEAPVIGAGPPVRDPREPEGTPGAEPVSDARIEPPAAVRTLLEAPYLSPEEASRLRVLHGAWTREDLTSADLMAACALQRGDVEHRSLLDPATPPLLRAEGAIRRGEPGLALELLSGDTGYRAVRLRVEALESLGRYDDALAAAAPALDRLRAERTDSASDLTDAVLTLIARARIAGPERADGTDFRTLMDLLTRARGELDALAWPAALAEATLLYDKDERERAAEAAMEAVRLNPSCAQAWALLGRLAVDSFDFDRAESIVRRLDALAASEAAWWTFGDGAPPVTDRPSVLGTAVLARARIRQDAPEAGIQRVREVLERLPAQREALASLAALHAASYNGPATDAALSALDALSPGTDEGYLIAGWALSERRQYTRAAELLEEAARRRPGRPEAPILLGLLELQSGRDLNALAALRRVAELDPFNARATNSLSLLEELATYDTIETEHFIVRHRPGEDGVLAREIAPAMEAVHARVTGAERGGIDHRPAQKTVIELMPNHRWFAVRIAGMPRLHTIAAATGPVIAMEAPRIGPDHKVGVYDWRRTLQHEYVHTVTLSRTGNRLPHWFTEAAAQHLEDAPRDEATCRLLASRLAAGTLFDLDEINIRFTRPIEPADRQLAYAQGHWMYEHLIETFGDDAPRRLMDAYARGEREAAAMPSVLGIDREAFLDGFTAWASGEARAWGLLPAEGGPTPGSLATRDGLKGEPSADDLRRWNDELPGTPSIIEALAQATIADGAPLTEADLALLRAWAEAVPVAEKPHRLLARHEQSSADGGRERAIPHLEFLDARAQYTPAYAAALATRYAESRMHDLALAKAERASGIAPYDATLRELAARVAIVAGAWDTAERHLDALVILEPDRPEHAARVARLRELRPRPAP
jgi:tetratricopeptide (TPR) repeat protein